VVPGVTVQRGGMAQERPGNARVAALARRLAGPGGSGFLDLRAAVLALRGELTAEAVPPPEVLAAALRADRTEVLVLDLARVPRCDEGGVDAVARLAGELAADGLALRLADPTPMVRMACYLDDRTAQIPVYDSVRAAALDDLDGLIQPNPPGL
jgi:anti-anti-sigma regulatory factor